MLKPRELQELGRLLMAQEWIFAKTMPDNPHWYTLRRTWLSDAAFNWAVEKIREGAYDEKYGGWWYRVININGMKYWSMGAPVEETILINRKYLTPADMAAFYDKIAPRYDSVLNDLVCLAENQQVMELIGDVSGQNVLDIGCGTGLLLDYLEPGDYTGIDPSFEMLWRLQEKHPRWADHVVPARLEEFVGGGYDLAVCLFGSANYIHPDYVAAIPELVRPGGRYVVMFFDEDYYPITYQRAGVTPPPGLTREGEVAVLPGERHRLGSYTIVDGRRAEAAAGA